MVEERLQEIKTNILEVYNELKSTNDEYEEVTMFDVVSNYTNNYNNKEYIGGKWIRQNIEELKNIPS